MKILLLFFLFTFSFKKSNAVNIFEYFAYSSGAAIIIDQYFDKSLKYENTFQKKIRVLEMYKRESAKPKFGYKISSRSDLIHYLDVIENLKQRPN